MPFRFEPEKRSPHKQTLKKPETPLLFLLPPSLPLFRFPSLTESERPWKPFSPTVFTTVFAILCTGTPFSCARDSAPSSRLRFPHLLLFFFDNSLIHFSVSLFRCLETLEISNREDYGVDFGNPTGVGLSVYPFRFSFFVHW